LKKTAAQTAGRYEPTVSQMVSPIGAAVIDYRSIDNLLIPLAIFLLLGEIFVRRRIIGE